MTWPEYRYADTKKRYQLQRLWKLTNRKPFFFQATCCSIPRHNQLHQPRPRRIPALLFSPQRQQEQNGLSEAVGHHVWDGERLSHGAGQGQKGLSVNGHWLCRYVYIFWLWLRNFICSTEARMRISDHSISVSPLTTWFVLALKRSLFYRVAFPVCVKYKNTLLCTFIALYFFQVETSASSLESACSAFLSFSTGSWK